MYELAIVSGLLLSPLVALLTAMALRVPLARRGRLPWRWCLLALVGGAAGVQLLVALTPEPVLGVFLPDSFDLGVRTPLMEEGLKGLVLLALCAAGALRDEVDGLAYGAIVGLGFALMENHRFFMIAPDVDVLMMLYVTRTLLATTGHALTSAIVGAGLGIVVSHRDAKHAALLPFAFVVAAALHGVHNVYGPLVGEPSFVLVSLAQILVFAAVVGLSYRRSRKLTTVTQENDHGHSTRNSDAE